MPHHEKIALSGVVQHVFAHRFTMEAEGTTHLADLGPKGAEAFDLSPGLLVKLEGERRPSEIKVSRIETEGRKPVEIEHKKPNHPPGGADIDPARALEAVRRAGWEPVGDPARKPKHVEIKARRADGPLTELHVDAEGRIYKEKPALAA